MCALSLYAGADYDGPAVVCPATAGFDANAGSATVASHFNFEDVFAELTGDATKTPVETPASPLHLIDTTNDMNAHWQPKELPPQLQQQQQQHFFNTMNFHAMSDCIGNIPTTSQQRPQEQQKDAGEFGSCAQMNGSSLADDEYVSFECVKKLLLLDVPEQIDEYMVNNVDGIASDLQSATFEIDYFNGIM